MFFLYPDCWSSGFSWHTFSPEIGKNFAHHNVNSLLCQQVPKIEAKLPKKRILGTDPYYWYHFIFIKWGVPNCQFFCATMYCCHRTYQASRHKAREHKLRRCRFRTVLSAMLNCRCVSLLSKEERGKMKIIFCVRLPVSEDAVSEQNDQLLLQFLPILYSFADRPVYFINGF